MLRTPPAFTPLIKPQKHFNTVTLVFHRDRLLLCDADLAPAPAAVTDALAIAPARLHAIGLWDGRYYQAAWVDDDSAPGGHSYHGLRALFGRLDDHLLGLAGRANQIVEWARTHRFCCDDTAPTEIVEGERCARCPACGMTA